MPGQSNVDEAADTYNDGDVFIFGECGRGGAGASEQGSCPSLIAKARVGLAFVLAARSEQARIVVNVDETRVERVLSGDASYDSLDGEEQALVRAEWERRMTARREDLDYADEFTAAGESYSEADENGNVRTVHPR